MSENQCEHCLNRKLADAFETWTMLSAPKDRTTQWNRICSVLQQKIFAERAPAIREMEAARAQRAIDEEPNSRRAP